MSRIYLENVNVHYPVMQDHYRSIRRAFLRKISRGRVYGEDGHTNNVHALKNINIDLRDGDRVGLIGRNGAGKSTLLRTLGRFILPDTGKVLIEGNITSLFSVNGGMDVERSGYDNVFLMGRLLGMSRSEMEENLPDIVEFSELGEFMSLPVRAYSDGMKVRLGVAVVTCVKPDILLLDEAIGATDAHFIEKTTRRAQQLYDRASIIVMASHSTEILTNLCNKALWIEHGSVVKFGGVGEVLGAYMDTTSQRDAAAA
jgi:ABC-type polysaccharide/polyol phosphate transport system ATPase subunit